MGSMLFEVERGVGQNLWKFRKLIGILKIENSLEFWKFRKLIGILKIENSLESCFIAVAVVHTAYNQYQIFLIQNINILFNQNLLSRL